MIVERMKFRGIRQLRQFLVAITRNTATACKATVNKKWNTRSFQMAMLSQP